MYSTSFNVLYIYLRSIRTPIAAPHHNTLYRKLCCRDHYVRFSGHNRAVCQSQEVYCRPASVTHSTASLHIIEPIVYGPSVSVHSSSSPRGVRKRWSIRQNQSGRFRARKCQKWSNLNLRPPNSAKHRHYHRLKESITRLGAAFTLGEATAVTIRQNHPCFLSIEFSRSISRRQPPYSAHCLHTLQ